jgi:hypothetical protein
VAHVSATQAQLLDIAVLDEPDSVVRADDYSGHRAR